MRKLILKMSISLDGFVGGADGQIDWIFRSSDDASKAWTLETISRAGLHIMGSRTFHDMRSYWPSSTDAFAKPMNEIPKAVFSRSGAGARPTTRALEDATRHQAPALPPDLAGWNDARVLRGDLDEEIARLKREPGGPLVAHGGASFARSLVAHGLVDEFRLLVFPVVLGRGLPIFSDLTAPRALALVGATPFPAGVVALVYRPADPGMNAAEAASK
ncbi:MAG TPA: dihydrofolate reductase family protein [Polyangia bacterium]|nr:dihydrofolate reductase family protein [Polyangia bacterium]